MIFTKDQANRLFDIIETIGQHEDSNLGFYRPEFVRNAMAGVQEHYYVTRSGSAVTVFFQEGSQRISAVLRTARGDDSLSLMEQVNTALAAFRQDAFSPALV